MKKILIGTICLDTDETNKWIFKTDCFTYERVISAIEEVLDIYAEEGDKFKVTIERIKE